MSQFSTTGTVKITTPDGVEGSFPILKGVLDQQVLDIRTLFPQLGLYTYDPGFTATCSCMSQITYTDANLGELYHFGYCLQDLCRNNATYLEVCFLLLYGELPCQQDLDTFEREIKSRMLVHERLLRFYKGFQQGAHPMAIMVGVIGALSAFMHEETDVTNDLNREQAVVSLIAKMPMLASAAYRTAEGLPIVYPKMKYSYIQNFLHMMFSSPLEEEYVINRQVEEAMELIFVTHADHEQNASTSTVRIAGSSEANPFACVAAGIASLWGPMHGGANESVLTMLDMIKDGQITIEEVIRKSKDRNDNFKLIGFGHRVYRNWDSRARILKEKAEELLADGSDQYNLQILQIAKQLEEAALADEYFIQRKIFPNIDYYSGILLSAIGVPRDMFTVIFAMARTIGWMVNWHEMMKEVPRKIGRPRQLYTGQKLRQFVHIDEREDSGLMSAEIVKSPFKKN